MAIFTARLVEMSLLLLDIFVPSSLPKLIDFTPYMAAMNGTNCVLPSENFISFAYFVDQAGLRQLVSQHNFNQITF